MTISDGHLGDLVSAVIDGELTAIEAAGAQAHLDECATCRAELRATAQARAFVRALPEIDPPFGVVERGLRQARRPRPFAWAASAAAAAAVVGLFAVSGTERVEPPVGQFVEVHATSSVNGDPLSNLGPVVIPVSFSE